MARDSFVFYKSFYEAIKNIPEQEQLKLYNAIFEYSFTEKEPELNDGIAKAMFILMKPNIDSANAKYKASVENGKKGGRPKQKPKNNPDITQGKPKNNPDITQEKAKHNLNDNDNVNDNVNDNDNVNVSSSIYDENVEKINKLMVECLNTTNINNIRECIEYLDNLPYELIEYALKKTSRIQKPSWKYAMSILDDYIFKHFKTIEEVKGDELSHTSNKQNNKNINDNIERWLRKNEQE